MNCRRSAPTSAGVKEDVSNLSKPRGCAAVVVGAATGTAGEGARALLASEARSAAERASPMEQLM